MILSVKSAVRLKGAIDLPASKSYSIRAFVVAACGGKSLIVDPSNSDDAFVGRKVAGQLGARIRAEKNNRWRVTAQFPGRAAPVINVGESGTVLRFLLPLLALQSRRCRVVGEGTLQGRPNAHLTQMLRRQGVHVRGRGYKETVPIDFAPGVFKTGTMTIDGTLSSQFISALLIACPQLAGDSRIRVAGEKMVSADYIEMTLNVLKRAGIKITGQGSRLYLIRGNQKFRGLKTFHVPSDYGLAAFPLAAACLVPSEVVLRGHLRRDWIQADGRIMNLLRRMGARFNDSAQSIRVSGPMALRGGNFSLKDCPDLVPIMTVMALFARGITRLSDIGHVRSKESDRIGDLRGELLKIGADIRESSNALMIVPRPQYRMGILLDPHHDHRLAMAFTVLGLKVGARVKDIECVSKSYPDFVRDMRSIGALKR
jgi:3-phosphoshikimate 1-carboxyvinyltransferase